MTSPLPITGTPLDYVPIDAPISRTTPTRFKAPTLKRAALAGVCAAAAIGVVYVFPIALAAGLVMTLAVWAGGKWADRLNAYDEARHVGSDE